jgi:hypothetical protein
MNFSEPGYYYQVIRSMLTPGHETELIYWLKSFGLIPNSQICKNAKMNQDCNKIMEWIPVKTVDYYQWKCRNCMEKKSIRENSVFQDVKCNFKNSIRILLGWCKGYDIETMANILGVKKQTVKVLYNVVTATARKHLKSHQTNKKIGGPGVIVIVDTYPEGCTNSSRPVQGNRPILCLAEVKEIPPNYWFEALNRFHRNNLDQIKSIKEDAQKMIQDVVLPGSVLVTRQDSTLCSFDDLQCLKHLYPTVVSVEGLARHNSDNQKILANLEAIWKIALDVCEEAQFFTYDQVPNFLISQMWHSRFGNEAFEMLLNRLTDMQ